MGQALDQDDKDAQVIRANGSIRLLHLLRVDLLVPVRRNNKPFPLEMGAVRLLRSWRPITEKDCRGGRQVAEWDRIRKEEGDGDWRGLIGSMLFLGFGQGNQKQAWMA